MSIDANDLVLFARVVEAGFYRAGERHPVFRLLEQFAD